MDKAGKGKKKSTTITKNPYYNRLGGKTFYIKSKFCSLYLDSNNVGDALISEEKAEREIYTKWVFQASDTPGVYTIKNLKTELYISTSDIGELYQTFLDEESCYQKWIVLASSEAENYVIINLGNSFCLSCDKFNKLILTILKEEDYEESPNNILFRIFQLKNKK